MSYEQAASGTTGRQVRQRIIVAVLVVTLLGMGGWWAYQNGSAPATVAASAGAGDVAQAALPVPPVTEVEAAPDVTSQPEAASAGAGDATPATQAAVIVGVTGVKGASLWGDDGALVAALDSGASIDATARTANRAWLWVETAAGSGWVQTSDVIAYGLQQLDTALLPGTVAAAAEHARVTLAVAVRETVAESDAGESAAMIEDETAANSTPADTGALVSVTSAPMVARVATADVRLNVRSGPGMAYPVVTKVDAGAVFTAIGRSAAGDWLLLQLSGDAGDVGWVSAEYIELGGDLQSLPSSDAAGSI